MIRPPPRSTPFPTRRSSDLAEAEAIARGLQEIVHCDLRVVLLHYAPVERSEEHTSELQSRRDLVCRLLLEKKKKKLVQNTLRNNHQLQADVAQRAPKHTLRS